MKPKVIILLGISGSGKGTQAKLIQEKMGLGYIGSGDLLRARSNINDFSGRKLKDVLEKGGFAPSAIIFKLWIDIWEEMKNAQEFQGFIIDGSPRKLPEAILIDQALDWYEWNKYFSAIFIDVSRDEALRRLKNRGREDDSERAINSRLDLFEKEVMPVIEYYKKSNKLITINGEQSVLDVHKDIITKSRKPMA